MATTLDLRALAAFRAAFGAVLLGDLSLRFGDLGAFYTDDGTLPRETLFAIDEIGRFSLLFASGHGWWPGLLLALAWLAAVAFLFGWRTRLAALTLFVLVASLQSRNPLVLIGGDILIMALLFWSLFLPLAARWSVDAAVAVHPPPRSNRHRSIAGTGLLLQVCSVYFFSAILKRGEEWWPDGTAVYYALSLERYTTGFGRWLNQFDALTQALSYGVYFLQWLVPLLVFAPLLLMQLRTLAMVLLMGMHIGFLLCLELGHFPLVSLASLLVLAPPALCSAFARRARRSGRVLIYYDQDCAFCLASCRMLRSFLALRAGIAPAQSRVRAQRLMDAHWSWVVIDSGNVAHVKYDAFVALLRASPLLFWLAPVAALPPLRHAGTWLYDRVASQRGRVADGTAWLWRPRPVQWRNGPLTGALAMAGLLTLLAWNLATVDLLPRAALKPVQPIVYNLRIDQLWNMFAPQPSRLDGWIVAPAEREDGTEFDLRRPHGQLDWGQPQPPNRHRNVRWHTYEWRLLEIRREEAFLAYGRYLCRRYNAMAEAGERVQRFDLVYVEYRSMPPGEARTPRRRTAWRHQCLPNAHGD